LKRWKGFYAKTIDMDDLADKKAKAAEKWAYYRESNPKKRKRLSDHTFAFCIDDVGAGWEYVHFELDGKTVSSFRVSYIGPDVRAFVECVTALKEKDFEEFVFLDEPGEHHVILSRRQEKIYVELPGMEGGFFLRYDVFAEKILESINYEKP
jgi:hypothetical protein